MMRYRGSEKVDAGLYFNFNDLSFVPLDSTGNLPGTLDDVYRKVPVFFLFVVAPILGAVYVIFLPVIGFVMIGIFVLNKLAEVCKVKEAVIRATNPVWQPMIAFLSRSGKSRNAINKNKVEANNTPKPRDSWAEETKKKLAEDEPKS